MIRRLILLFALLAMPAGATTLTGVNIAGGEFGGLLAVYGKNYIYPDAARMQAFRDMGVNVIRVPMRWERLQTALHQPLDPTEMGRIDKVIDTARGMGLSVIIDIHNYGRYARKSIGGPDVPSSALADLWGRLARRYRGRDEVIFGLMNEPIRINATDWGAVAQEAVNAIRAEGATNLVLVPGAYWSGAHSWSRKALLPSNADAMAGFRDPAGNMAFDLHQYFDGNSSGTSAFCVTPEVAVQRLAVATDWLRKTGNRGFLSEFGVSQSPECAPVLEAALRHLANNREWLGWTIWASSAWFGSYIFSLDPFKSPPPPQLVAIKPYLAR